MLTKFTNNQTEQHIEICDFDPPGPGEDRRFSAMINDDQFVVLKMTDVGNYLQSEDLSEMSLCEGLIEMEVLPMLTSIQIKSEVNSLVFIEKLNQNVIYR